MGNEIEVATDAYDLQKWLSYSSSSSSSAVSSLAVSVPLLPKIPNLSLNHVSFVCKFVKESVRLFNNGIGIRLESENVKNKKGAINPKDNNISFQSSDLKLLEQRLDGRGIDYVSAAITKGGIQVNQIFFHDFDGYMVKICSCENLPILPITSCPLKPPKPRGSDMQCATQVSAMMMENLLIDKFDISV